MPKAYDASHDYYEDLEVPSDASIDDIKRQFRKLALKYHPDRNPGQEVEVIAKFQVIQRANEILTDPVEKAAYDNDRRKSALRNGFTRPAPPSRRNHTYAPGTEPPPPTPRHRNRAPPPPPPEPPTGNPSGATRYSNFPPPPKPPKERPRTWQDAQTRNNIFNAYQNMTAAQKASAQRQQGYPAPAPHHASGSRPSSRPTSSSQQGADEPKMRSAYEEMQRPGSRLNRTQSSRVPRKQGFDPNTMDGNEGQAASTAYASPRFDRNNPPRMHDNFPRPDEAFSRGQAPTARRPEHPQSFRSHSGDEVPYTEGTGRQSTPYTTHTGEKTFFDSSDLRRHSHDHGTAQRPAVGRHRSYSPPTERPSTMHESPPNANHFQNAAPGRPFVKEMYSSDEPEDETESDESWAPASSDVSARKKAQPGSAWTRRTGSSSRAQPGSLEEQENVEAGQSAGLRSDNESVFNFHRTTSNTSQHSAYRPKSMDHIDTRFSDQAVRFTSHQESRDGLPRAESHPDISRLNSDFSKTSYQRSPLHGEVPLDPTSQNELASGPPKSSGDVPSGEGGDPAASQASDSVQPEHSQGFEQRKWSEDLNNGNWAERWANPSQAETSPTRNAPQGSRHSRSSTNRISRTHSRPSTNPMSASVAEEGAERQNVNGTDEDTAMDIDDEPVSDGHSRPSITVQPPSSGTRPVFVEPQRPEWLFHSPSDASTNPNVQQSATSSIGMQELRNVAPISADAAGLSSFSDVQSALPFPSQAAKSYPVTPTSPESVNAVNNSILFKLPRPPVPPADPPQLTLSKWELHLQHMRLYLNAWNNFNRKMAELLNLQAQRYCAMEKGPAGGMVPGWLGATGGTRELGGWDAYVQALADERKVQEYWEVAKGKHHDTVLKHSRLRERVLRGETVGSFA